MAEDNLTTSSIFLTIICSIIIIISVLLNFGLLLTLLKVRRIRRTDKSNYFLTHLILSDLGCSIFVCVPSAYGIYNSGDISNDWCHIQLFFYTFGVTLTFHGLLAASIERLINFYRPKLHDDTFTTEGKTSSWSACGITFAIIASIWALDVFISCWPLFANIDDLQYFEIESQCDYIYENFEWWIFLNFFISIVVPFVFSLVFFIVTLVHIKNTRNEFLKAKYLALDNQVRKFSEQPTTSNVPQLKIKVKNKTKLDRIRKIEDSYKYGVLAGRNRDGSYTDTTSNVPKLKIKVENKTKLDRKRKIEDSYKYGVLADRNRDGSYTDTDPDSMRVRRKQFESYVYNTDKSKTETYLIITCISFVLVLPIYVIHFYRTFTTTGTDYDDNTVVDWKTYTAFAWISYLVFIVKPAVCFTYSDFYRNAFLQAANQRSFSGKYDYEIHKLARKEQPRAERPANAETKI